jgi:hypothetical protein
MSVHPSIAQSEINRRASVWLPGSYDAELNLAFFGPAQTNDTAPLRNPSGQPGVRATLFQPVGDRAHHQTA